MTHDAGRPPEPDQPPGPGSGPPPEADDTPAGGPPSADGAGAGDEERESAYELLQRGQDLLTQRHFAQAAVVLERADRAEPRKASILEALGRAYYNSAQRDRARETFEELLEIDPSAHYAHFALGQSLKQLGRVGEARTHLRLAVALSPSSRIYAAALARLPSARRGADGRDDEGEAEPGSGRSAAGE